MTQNLPVAKQKADSIRALFAQKAVRNQLAMALPKHLTVDRLLRVAMTSIQRTPKLMDCTQKSLLACIMTCAQLGLEPDQFLGQAYLVPFRNKGTLEAQLIPGYRGYIALARRSGEVQSVSSQVVYANDDFKLQYGLEEVLEHVPSDGERGDPIGAYVVFRYKDGGHSFDYMTFEDIEKVRARSKSKDDGPWVTDWAEMAKKTVIKRHAKLAPMSIEFMTASALEDRAFSGETQMDIMLPEEDNTINGDFTDETDYVQVFTDSIPKGTDEKQLSNFLEVTAKANKKTVDELKAEAGKDTKGFWKYFDSWLKKQKKEETHTDICPNTNELMDKELCEKCKEREGCPCWVVS